MNKTITKNCGTFKSSAVESPVYGQNIALKSSDYPKYSKLVKAEVTLTGWASIRYPEGVWYVIVGNAGRSDYVNIADDTSGSLYRYKSPSVKIRAEGAKQTRTFSLSNSSSNVPCFGFDETYTYLIVSFRCTARVCRVEDFTLTLTYQVPSINLVVNYQGDSGSGTVSGSCTYDIETIGGSKVVTISANPSKGYTLSKWVRSDGVEFPPNKNMSVTLSESMLTSNSTTVTYTAVFKPIPVTGLSLSHSELNIKLSDKVDLVYNYIDTLYRNRDTIPVSEGSCEIEPNYVILKSTGDDCHIGTYDMSGNPANDIVRKFMFGVSPGTEYTFKLSAKVSNGNSYAMFIFYYDSSYRYISLDHREGLVSDSTTFQSIAPANAAYCTVRLDNNVANNIVYYTNVVVYKESIDSNLYNNAAIAQIIEPYDALNKLGIWSSSNPDIVSVDESTGVLTAHNPGTATITCKARDATNGVLTKQCIVTVISTTNIYLGDTLIVKVCLGDKRIKSAFLGDLSLL